MLQLIVLSPLVSLAANSFLVLLNYYIIIYDIIITINSSSLHTSTTSSDKTRPDERVSASNNFTGALLESNNN